MRVGERHDHLGECSEVKVEEPADGVVVEKHVVLARERTEAGWTIVRISAGVKSPTPGFVSPELRSARADPAIAGEGAAHGCGRAGVEHLLGVEWQDARTWDSAAGKDHGAAEIRGSPAFGVNPLSSADVLPKCGDQAQVAGQPRPHGGPGNRSRSSPGRRMAGAASSRRGENSTNSAPSVSRASSVSG